MKIFLILEKLSFHLNGEFDYVNIVKSEYTFPN